MSGGIENPMNSTNNKQNFNDENLKKISTKPFMQLNLSTIPESFDTKVSIQHQCYRLVPDDLLSINDDDDEVKDNYNHSNNDCPTYGDKQCFNSSTPKNNCQQQKRRQLPKIPSDKK
ncbi:hypothetical protein BLA29_012188, partial [Euroglyphus maynei]